MIARGMGLANLNKTTAQGNWGLAEGRQAGGDSFADNFPTVYNAVDQSLNRRISHSDATKPGNG